MGIHGRFQIIGNMFYGFDEPGCAALALYVDRFGQPVRNLYRDNLFERCASAISESQKGLWDAGTVGGNLFTDCGSASKQP